MELDVRHLRLVVAIAEAGSLTAAARALNIAQPSVSSQLRRIEDSLGGPLFERSSTGVRPTGRGRALLRRARPIIEGVDEIAGDSGVERAPAAVGVRTFILPFERLLPLVQQLVPGTRWRVDAGSASEGLAAVAEGEADLYFGLFWDDAPPPPRGLVIDEVLRERGWVVLPADHRFASEPVVELASLADEAWVSRPEPELVQALMRDCRRSGFEPDIRCRAVDSVSLLAVVASGSGVAMTSPIGDVNDFVAMRPCSGTVGYAWVLGYRPGAISPAVIDTLSQLMRWAYLFKAQSHAELMAMLPADLLAAQFPTPLEPVAHE